MGFFGFVLTTMFVASSVEAWTGEIHGRVVCDVCGDSSIGPEDHVLEGHYLSLSLSFIWQILFFWRNFLLFGYVFLLYADFGLGYLMGC